MTDTTWVTQLPNGTIVMGKGRPNPDVDIANEINQLRDENARLREQVAALTTERDNARISWDTNMALTREVAHLREQVVALTADVAEMLRTPHNHDWLPTDDCRRCAIEQRLIAAVRETNAPSGYRHAGGHWITCPFCVDDPLGMCSACNGTRRIMEYPREDSDD